MKEIKKPRFPSWLRKKLPKRDANFIKIIKTIEDKANLPTVCREAHCPNCFECFSNKRATFLALGKVCTRHCRFCSISHGQKLLPLDPQEPKKIATSVKTLDLKHVVITMVTRDDLEDGGAHQMAKILKEIKILTPNISCEVLTSDFDGNLSALDTLLKEEPDIFNHNVETVRSLSKKIRDRADYDRSLLMLKTAKEKSKSQKLLVKSGLMVGLGERKNEVFQTIEDLYEAGCDLVTIGQYLQPSKEQWPIDRFVSPEEFKEYETFGHSIGISRITAGPFVRSSYEAETHFKRASLRS